MVDLSTTATGGLASTAQSTIDVTFPAGTTFAGFGGGGVFVGTTRVGNCPTPNASRLSTCGIFAAIGPTTIARLEFNGITNPSTAGTTNKVTVATSSDTTPVDSANYTVAPANTLTNLAVNPGSSSQSATTQYIATFTTSPTGGLSSTAQSTIDVTFPAGTTFANYGGGGVFNGTTRIGNCSAPVAATPLKSTCGIFASIGPSTTTRLEFNGVTNPSTPGNYRITVVTSSDPSPVVSSQYGIAMDTVPPETSLVSGPAWTRRPTRNRRSRSPRASRARASRAASTAHRSPPAHRRSSRRRSRGASTPSRSALRTLRGTRTRRPRARRSRSLRPPRRPPRHPRPRRPARPSS